MTTFFADDEGASHCCKDADDEIVRVILSLPGIVGCFAAEQCIAFY
jgi:hypothetical protein